MFDIKANDVQKDKYCVKILITYELENVKIVQITNSDEEVNKYYIYESEENAIDNTLKIYHEHLEDETDKIDFEKCYAKMKKGLNQKSEGICIFCKKYKIEIINYKL